MGYPLSNQESYLAGTGTKGEKITIRVASTNKEREKVYRFRYQIYIEEMGKQIPKANHRKRLLYDDMDDWGDIFYASVAQKVVGTIRLHIGYNEAFPQEIAQPLAMDRFQSFKPSNGSDHKLSFASKGMVAPNYRNSQVFNLLTLAFYKMCRQQGVLFNFVGCAPSLVPVHERIGSRRYKGSFFVPDYGCMVPLVNLLDDVDHLKQVGSPFQALVENWPHTQETIDWYSREFPNAAQRYVNKRLTTETQQWHIIKERLGQTPQKSISLFRGLSEAEARCCAYLGHLVYFEKGETIVYPDDVSNEIFVVISGEVDIHSGFFKRRPIAVKVGPGKEFGEQTFLTHSRQNVSMVAQTDTELLILPRRAIERLQLQIPDLACKLINNMAIRKYA